MTSDSTDANAQPHLPLKGIVVVELAHFLAGPMVCRILRDLGAEVIKVEPLGGEAMRTHGPAGDRWMPSPTFLALHRDKLSLELDLKSASGLQAFKDLVRAADVVVENFRPGVATRLGVGPEAMRALNPRLIYCTLNGFGIGGPLTDMPATDGVVQAFSGIVEQLAARNEQFATPASFAIADVLAGSTTAHAVLAALFGRERTGVGCYVDMTMAECALFARMLSTERGMVSPNTIVAEAADGVLLALQTVPGLVTRFLELLRTVPGCEDMADDSRFTSSAGRIEHEEVYLERVRAGIKQRPSGEWLEVFMKYGVPAAPMHTMESALGHPQVVNRTGVMEVSVPGLGEVRLPTPPYVMDGQRVTSSAAPAELGAHNAEVMRRFAGYSDAQIEGLFGSTP